jgi:acyl-CoA dehydrogenase
MAAELHAARLVCHEAAWRYERQPENRPQIGAMAKRIASEMAFRTADRTVQLFGGAGYRRKIAAAPVDILRD